MALKQYARGLWASFVADPFKSPNGMEENLRLIDDHLGLYTLQAPQAAGTALPVAPADGDGQIFSDGSYVTFNAGTWKAYAPRRGIRAVLVNGTDNWLNTGTSWAQYSVVDSSAAIAAATAAGAAQVALATTKANSAAASEAGAAASAANAIAARDAAGSFDTLALANAALAGIAANAGVYIVADTAANTGFWVKQGGVLVKKSDDTLMTVAQRIRRTLVRSWAVRWLATDGKQLGGFNRYGRLILSVGGDIVARITGAETGVATIRNTISPSGTARVLLRILDQTRTRVLVRISRKGRFEVWGRDILSELDLTKAAVNNVKTVTSRTSLLRMIFGGRVVLRFNRRGRLLVWDRDVLAEIDAVKSYTTPEGMRSSAAYVVVPFLDSAGKHQIRTIRRSDGKVTILTTVGNNVDPSITNDGQVLFLTDTAGAWRSVFASADGGPILDVLPSADMVVWADSLGAGAGSSGTGAGQGPWPKQLSDRNGRSVVNEGIGGQNSQQISARQGGTPIAVTVAGNQIPASGAVAVTDKSVNILFNSGSYTGSAACVLVGVAGVMSTDGSGNWTFTRSSAGSAVACAAGSTLTLPSAVVQRSKTVILAYGRNDGGSDPAPILGFYAASINYLLPYCKQVLKGLILNATDEPSGSANYIAIKTKNDAIKAAYPTTYLDLQSPPTTEEMAAIGYTPTSGDLVDIGRDCIPTGMRSDAIHGNNYMYALFALRADRKLNSLGW